MTRVLGLVVRARYVWIALVASVVAQQVVAAAGPHQYNDWVLFEAAARSIVHFRHLPVYGGNPLDLYARLPAIQIGPPAILPVSLFQALSPWTVSRLFIGVIVALAFAAVVAAEVTARTGGRPTPRDLAAPATLIGGLIIVVDWSWCAVRWHHLDDAMALSFFALACWLIARGRAWWLVGLLVGTAVAAKPWAIILTPVLLGLPRTVRSKAVLVGLATAAAWWAPFVIGGPGTTAALGGYHVSVQNGSVLSLLGIHGDVQRWLRPVQFVGGVTAGVVVARRGGRAWLAAPLAALAFRVLTDPFDWGYYGMGPILFALVWDLARPNARRVPIYTIVTAVIEGLVPKLVVVKLFGEMTGKAYLMGSLKLIWGLGILLALALELRRCRSVEEPAAVEQVQPESAVAAGSDGRRWWTPVRVALGVTILVCGLGFVQKAPCLGHPATDDYRFTRLCYTDTYALYTAEGLNARSDARGVVTGAVSEPYRDVPVEYPPVMGALMWVPAVVTSSVHGATADLGGSHVTTFFTLTAIGLAALALLSTWTVAELAGKRGGWQVMMVAASPVLLLHAYTNWDLAAVSLTGLGLWAWSRGSPVWAGVIMGLATATKLYPLLVLAALVMLCARDRRWHSAAKAVAGAAGALVIAYLPAVVLSYQTPSAVYHSAFVFPSGCPTGHPLRGWQWFSSLSAIRGVDWGSIWLVVQHVFSGDAIGRALSTPARCDASPTTLNILVAVTMALVVAGVGVLVAKASTRPRVGQVAFLLVAGFVMFNKIDSPQYALWLVPLAVLARPRWASLLVWQGAEVLLGAANLLLLAHAVNPDHGLSLNVYCVFVVLRDLVLAGVMALVVRDVLRPEGDIVRRDGVDDPAGGVLLGAS